MMDDETYDLDELSVEEQLLEDAAAAEAQALVEKRPKPARRSSKLMSREAYNRAAAGNPDAPSYDQAKANVVKQLIGQAVRSIDQQDAPEVSAGYLAGAMNVLLERADG